MVFLPSMRYGSFSVAASIQTPGSAAIFSATRRPASPIRPFTRYSSAPAAAHSARVIDGASAGIATSASRPARAA